MRLVFCALCGSVKDLVHHHVVPRSIGGSDEETNLLTVCPPCHGTVHGMAMPANIRELTKAGLARARAKGRYGGRRPKLTAEQIEMARGLLAGGKPPSEVARAFQVGKTTLYRSLQRDNAAGNLEQK